MHNFKVQEYSELNLEELVIFSKFRLIEKEVFPRKMYKFESLSKIRELGFSTPWFLMGVVPSVHIDGNGDNDVKVYSWAGMIMPGGYEEYLINKVFYSGSRDGFILEDILLTYFPKLAPSHVWISAIDDFSDIILRLNQQMELYLDEQKNLIGEKPRQIVSFFNHVNLWNTYLELMQNKGLRYRKPIEAFQHENMKNLGR